MLDRQGVTALPPNGWPPKGSHRLKRHTFITERLPDQARASSHRTPVPRQVFLVKRMAFATNAATDTKKTAS